MKIFQIVNGMCHWLTPFQSLAETMNFPPDCLFVEAPDKVTEQWGFDETKKGDERFIRPATPEGWEYDDETGTFYPISAIPQMLLDAQVGKQNENKMKLAERLASHPITWNDGKKYGVTMEDQSEMQLNLTQYTLQKEAAKEDPTIIPVLEWHAIHEACTPWTEEEFNLLSLAVSSEVYPWFQLMNYYKERIFEFTDRKEARDYELDYSPKAMYDIFGIIVDNYDPDAPQPEPEEQPEE